MKFPQGLPKLDWKPNTERKIKVYNVGFVVDKYQPPSSRPCLTVICTEYRDREDAWLHKSWLSGQGRKCSLQLPPYAIEESRGEKLKEDLRDLFSRHFNDLLDELPNGQDPILSVIINEAKRNQEKVSF